MQGQNLDARFGKRKMLAQAVHGVSYEAGLSVKYQQIRELVNQVIPDITMPSMDYQAIRDNGRKVLAMHIMAVQDAGLKVLSPEPVAKAPVAHDLLTDGLWWAQRVELTGLRLPKRYDPEIVMVAGSEATPVNLHQHGYRSEHTPYPISMFTFISPITPPHSF